MEEKEYILLNCENAKKLIRYTSSINYYIFYDDYINFKKNKEIYKKDLIVAITNFIVKLMAKNAMGSQMSKIVGSQAPQLIGKLFQKGGIGLKSISGLTKKIKVPKSLKSKSLKSVKSLKSAKNSAKSAKSSKLFDKVSGIADKVNSKKSLITKPCEFFGSIAADSGFVDTSEVTSQISEIGKIIYNFGKKYKLESIKFMGEILTDKDTMEENGKKIIIRSLCDDPFLSFEACVLRKPTAIAQLALTGGQETLKQIDKMLKEKYKDQHKMFDNKIITFKKGKISAKYITNKKNIVVSIVGFNLNTKQITIEIQQKKNKWVKKSINKENVAFTKNKMNYTDKKLNININNINDYLITNIDDKMLDACPKDDQKISKKKIK